MSWIAGTVLMILGLAVASAISPRPWRGMSWTEHRIIWAIASALVFLGAACWRGA